jgi:hemolysin-activating ACP:hemolysin acyltransferase
MGKKIMHDIIKFYKSFDRYNCFTDQTIFEENKDCFKYKQYKIFKENNKIYGFVNWTFLDLENLNYFLKTGIVEKYNSGNIFVHLDFLAKKNIKEIYKWSLKNITKYIGLNKQTQWLRLNKNNGVRNIIRKTIKESWYG